MAERVQMSRQRPWRADHPDAVIVARPSKWGNPYRIGGLIVESVPPAPGFVRDTLLAYRVVDADDAVRLFTNWLTNTVDAEGRYCHGLTTYFGADSSLRPTVDEIRTELAGRDLACWCKLGAPCHADVLLRIANRGA